MPDVILSTFPGGKSLLYNNGAYESINPSFAQIGSDAGMYSLVQRNRYNVKRPAA